MCSRRDAWTLWPDHERGQLWEARDSVPPETTAPGGVLKSEVVQGQELVGDPTTLRQVPPQPPKALLLSLLSFIFLSLCQLKLPESSLPASPAFSGVWSFCCGSLVCL